MSCSAASADARAESKQHGQVEGAPSPRAAPRRAAAAVAPRASQEGRQNRQLDYMRMAKNASRSKGGASPFMAIGSSLSLFSLVVLTFMWAVARRVPRRRRRRAARPRARASRAAGAHPRASQAIGSAEIPDIKKAWIFCLLAVIGFRYHAVKDSFPAVYQKACRDMGIDPSDGQKLADKKKKR